MHIVPYAEFTPNSRGHTWYVTVIFAVSKKVPWFNLFCHKWYIMYISSPISRTVRHLWKPLTTVLYRTVSLSKPYTPKATCEQSIVTAVRCELAIIWDDLPERQVRCHARYKNNQFVGIKIATSNLYKNCFIDQDQCNPFTDSDYIWPFIK